MQQNNRFQAGGGPPPGALQTATFHHRNPYPQQQNGGALNGANGIMVDGQATHISGETSPINGINVAAATAGVAAVDLYSTNGAEDLQQAQSAQPAQAQAYTNLNSTTTYPAAPSPNAGLYSAGQYMVDAGVQNMIGKY